MGRQGLDSPEVTAFLPKTNKGSATLPSFEVSSGMRKSYLCLFKGNLIPLLGIKIKISMKNVGWKEMRNQPLQRDVETDLKHYPFISNKHDRIQPLSVVQGKSQSLAWVLVHILSATERDDAYFLKNENLVIYFSMDNCYLFSNFIISHCGNN